MLRPHQFPAFLKSFAGFGAMKVLRKTREKGHAFNRPIMAFLKGSLDTHALTTRETHHIFAEDPLDGDLGAVNIVGHHVAPLAHVPGIIVPEIVPPVDPVPQNLVPVPANVTPSNATPVSATPASPAPANSIPENAAPADLAVNGAQEDGHDEETENDEGNDGRQAEGSVAIPPENTIQKSIQPVSPEVSSSHLNDTEQRQGNETAREAHAGAASDGNAAPRTSGCKRMRSDEGTDESDERCTKVVKHDTDAAAQ